MILTKVLWADKCEPETDPNAHSHAVTDFITTYSENAIKDSFFILVRNMERDLRHDPDETMEKLELAVGVVNFLKSMSTDSELC